MRIAVVFGTYNRFYYLRAAVDSVRNAISNNHVYKMIVVDGGSSDGSRPWLEMQDDVDLIRQEGELTGAVRAFNLGFGQAVDGGYDFVFHLNDDAFIATPGGIDAAIEMMQYNERIGEVAFAYNLNSREFRFEYINGKPYANYGLIRTAAGMQVAQAQGDPTGRAWWNPIYKTYGADCEFACWLHRLGWIIATPDGLHVHDANAQDELRQRNGATDPDRVDSKIFWNRWHDPVSLKPGGPEPGSSERPQGG